MVIHFKAATREEMDQANRFTTYANYLSTISINMKEMKENPTNILKEIVQSNAFSNIQGGRCKDYEKVGRFFRNAWYTEIQMSYLPEEFVRYSNHWAPVQLYYMIYLAIRAYFASKSASVVREHATNLKSIAEEVKDRRDMFPYPWKVCCVGDPDSSSLQYLNLPEGVSIQKISSLTSSSKANFWDSYGMFLRTTRSRQIESWCEVWKTEKQRKKVNSKEKIKYVNNLSPTTLFNCLYRLRIRSNYADADSFLLSSPDDERHVEFHNSLQMIGYCSLMIFELLVARYITKKHFEEILSTFIKHEKSGLSKNFCELRWQQMRDLW